MATGVLAALPERFDAGTTVKYATTHADYPSSGGWALTLQASGAGLISVAGIPSGDAFDITIPASTTATVSVADAATTAGSKTLAKAASSFITAGVRAGDLVTGPGIPRGAYVDGNYPIAALSLTMSEAAETTASTLALKFIFPAGTYAWKEIASKAGEVFVADKGTVNIDPEIGGVPKEERWLALVNDVIEGRISSDAAAYQIGDRAKTFVRIEQWIAFARELEAVVRQRRTPGKLSMARVMFTGAGAEP
jgi:hypothetical protein